MDLKMFLQSFSHCLFSLFAGTKGLGIWFFNREKYYQNILRFPIIFYEFFHMPDFYKRNLSEFIITEQTTIEEFVNPSSRGGQKGRVESKRRGFRLKFVFTVSHPFVCECPSITTMPYFQLPLIKPYVQFSCTRLSNHLLPQAFAFWYSFL